MNTAFLQKRPQTSLAGFSLFIFDSSFNTLTLCDSRVGCLPGMSPLIVPSRRVIMINRKCGRLEFQINCNYLTTTTLLSLAGKTEKIKTLEKKKAGV